MNDIDKRAWGQTERDAAFAALPPTPTFIRSTAFSKVGSDRNIAALGSNGCSPVLAANALLDAVHPTGSIVGTGCGMTMAYCLSRKAP